MIAAPTPSDELERLERLRALGVIDTPPEERFDRYTRLARRLFDVPVALVSLVDAERQFYKSRDGLDLHESPRETSFCGHAICSDDVMVVPDALADPRFASNPYVTTHPGVRFYAGCPVGQTPDGSALGTLCLLDRQPREFSDEDVALLRDLAAMVSDELVAVELATTDPVTGISNRLGFAALADRALARAAREGRDAALLSFRLDEPGAHADGTLDAVLVAFARALAEAVRGSDVYGRLDGATFGVVLTRVAPPDGGEGASVDDLLARLQQALAAAGLGGLRCHVGVARFDPAAPRSLEALLTEADVRPCDPR